MITIMSTHNSSSNTTNDNTFDITNVLLKQSECQRKSFQLIQNALKTDDETDDSNIDRKRSAMEMYKAGIRELEKGISLDIDGFNGERWDRARRLKENMKRNLEMVKERLNRLEKIERASINKGVISRNNSLPKSASKKSVSNHSNASSSNLSLKNDEASLTHKKLQNMKGEARTKSHKMNDLNDSKRKDVVIMPNIRPDLLSALKSAPSEILSDGTPQWTVYSSSQNLASVLHDPSKPRSYNDTLLTKDWGAYFVDTTTIPPSPFHPKISHAHFDIYLRKIIKRNKMQRNKIRNESFHQQRTPSRDVDSCVPKIFFNSDFNLEDTDTFKKILSFCINKDALLQTSPNEPTKWNHVARESLKELQRNFSEYLDVVEENLPIWQISIRSQDFFQVMSAMDTVMDQLIKTIKEVTLIRKKCHVLEKTLVKPRLINIQLQRKKMNAEMVMDKVKLMCTVHQTQPTIQLLLSTPDFVGALDLISTSQEVVTQELSGVLSFRHLKLQLIEIEKVIDKMMQEEFVKYLNAEWNRPFDMEQEEKYVIEEERLLAIVFGMLRMQCFNFTDVFREEACTTLKAVVKQTVIEALSKEDTIEVQKDGTLFDQLRVMEFTKWIEMLNSVFHNLLIVIHRIHAVQSVMQKGFQCCANRDEQRKDELDMIVCDGNIDSTKILLEGDLIELTSHLRESLCSICDYAHSRCANVIESRAKEGTLDKLSPTDFVSLAKSIEDFANETQNICGRRSPNLKLVLQTQTNKFATRFHEERKKKLSGHLDIEQWKSLESTVSLEFQDMMNQVFDKAISLSDVQKYKMNGDSSQKTSKSFALVNGQKYMIVGAVVTVVNLMVEYCQCAAHIPSVAPDLLTRLLDLLKFFNARTSQLVLGAGALQVSGLKTITARNLILSSRCLQLVVIFIPFVKKHFETILNQKQLAMCKHFDEIIKAYNEHIAKIPEKIITILKDVTETQLSKWEAKPPVPSEHFKSVSQHLMRLHDNIQDALPIEELVHLFKQIHEAFKQVLKLQLQRLKIAKDGGPQHGLVIQELTFHIQNLRKLIVAKHVNFNFDNLWD